MLRLSVNHFTLPAGETALIIQFNIRVKIFLLFRF